MATATPRSPAEAFQVGAEFRGYLADSGIAISANQQTKTALEHFGVQIAAGNGPARTAKK
jgi:hypothetical protein